jgi:glycyl-tRNA synthetase alpha chain
MNIIDLINGLSKFWQQFNINRIGTWDMEMGAATFHPICFFSTLKNNSFGFSYLQPSRRQADGKYGLSPNRVVRHHQFQTLIHGDFILEKGKNTLEIIKDFYLKSLEYIGINLHEVDIRFIENDWESTALGAFGVGWEVWINGMEVTQFTFFTKMADMELNTTVIELAYGIERLALMLNNKTSFYELDWNNTFTYKDLFQQYEYEMTTYYLDTYKGNLENLEKIEENFNRAKEKKLSYPMYELVLNYNKEINLLLASRVIGQLKRKTLMNKMRTMVNDSAKIFLENK